MESEKKQTIAIVHIHIVLILCHKRLSMDSLNSNAYKQSQLVFVEDIPIEILTIFLR